MNQETGACIWGPKIQRAADRLVEAIQASAEGLFHPDRELTYTLENPEHPGRTRGKGPYVTWKVGFEDWIESYRSRQRKKNEEEDRIKKLEERMLASEARVREQEQRAVEQEERWVQELHMQRRPTLAGSRSPHPQQWSRQYTTPWMTSRHGNLVSFIVTCRAYPSRWRTVVLSPQLTMMENRFPKDMLKSRWIELFIISSRTSGLISTEWMGRRNSDMQFMGPFFGRRTV